MKTHIKLLAVLSGAAILSACSTPAALDLPDQDLIERRRMPTYMNGLPPMIVRIQPGDTLRIVRDAETSGATDASTLFQVRLDGSFSYPYAGRVEAAGKSPDDVAALLLQKLSGVYRHPQVTVNIEKAGNNKIFVGGAVRSPGAFELNGSATLEQMITAAGGVLKTADSTNVALLRPDGRGKYDVYFVDYARLLQPVNGYSAATPLQRGDLVYVPQSVEGALADGMQLYGNELIPFVKSVGIGYSYEVGR